MGNTYRKDYLKNESKTRDGQQSKRNTKSKQASMPYDDIIKVSELKRITPSSILDIYDEFE